MSTHSGKEIFWDFVSALVGVVAGIVSSVIVAFILMFFELEMNTEIFVFILVIVASMVAGLITALVVSGHYFLYSIIAGAIILFTWIILNDFDSLRLGETIMLLLILPLCIVGGWIGHSLKIKKQSTSL